MGKVHRASVAATKVGVNCVGLVCPLKGNCCLFPQCRQTQLLTPTPRECLYGSQKLAIATFAIFSIASVANPPPNSFSRERQLEFIAFCK